MSLANKLLAVGLPTTGWNDAYASSLGNDFVAKWSVLGNINQAIINTVFWVGIAISLGFGIINGVKYAMSGGDKYAAQAAKQGVTNAIIGFIIVVGFRTIVTLIMRLLGSENVPTGTNMPF
ncbi:pilin [Patescibacteria group bacterium]|nr:pilin [Patescibacteria group bacterium]